MNKKSKIKVYIAMFFAVLFWGFSFVWTKQVLLFYKPITVIYFRLVLSVLFLFVFGKIFNKIKPIHREDWKSILLIAFFEPFAYFIGENFGLTHVSSTVAAVLVSTIPLFSPLVTYIIHREKIGLQNFAGIILSIIGVFLVILKNDLGFKADTLGISLMMLAVFSAVFYSVLVVKVSNKYNVYSIIVYQNLIGIVLFSPIFFYFEFDSFVHTSFRWSAWIPLIELAIFASTFAFMLFTYGIRELGVIKANTLANFIPVVTALFSFFILGEQFSWLNISGIFIVVFGLILSQLDFMKKRYRVKP